MNQANALEIELKLTANIFITVIDFENFNFDRQLVLHHSLEGYMLGT